MEAEAFSAPDDSVAGEARYPEGEAEEIAEGEEPEIAKNCPVAEDADADGEGDGDAGEEDHAEEGEAPKGEAARNGAEQRPGEAEGDAEAEVSPSAGVSGGAGPAHLVIAEAGEGIGGDGGFDDLGGELHAEAGRGDAGAELVVVGEVLEDCFEAAGLLECGPAHGEGGAEAEADAAFEHAGGEDAGDEVG